VATEECVQGTGKPMWRGSPWWNTTSSTRFPRLERPLEVDVAVIGGGITGLTAAWQLTQARKRVAVLEAFTVGAGSTGDSTGHLTACLDQPYQELSVNFGMGDLKLVAQSSMSAIDFIQKTVSDLEIKCDFARVPGFRFTLSASGARGLEREAELTRQLGLRTAFSHATPLPFPVKGALRFEDQAQFDAPKYCQALAASIQQRHGLVFGDTLVDSVADGSPCVLRAGGHAVRAGAVIMATHVPINRVLRLQDQLAPVTTYTLACSLGSRSVPDGLFWDTEEPYHYLRSVLDQGRRLLLVGGADHPTGQEPATPRRFDQLEAYARKKFSVESIVYHGSGEVFVSSDGLPYIGRIPGKSAKLCVGTGFSGTGLTFGTIAGLLLADLVLGCSSPLTELFSPSRARRGTRANKGETPNPLRSESQHLNKLRTISRGEGKVLEKEGVKVAVYRDEGGTLHSLSADCTHMGCTVRWNGAAKSWDCPCHGGRYQPTGEVLCGPPTQGLRASRLVRSLGKVGVRARRSRSNG
jgi:glycine/D-amino acid oxidase-like deaminating enzyme/nitrite reductase/ring-hydroxylating ferredoxin subunit